MATRRKGFSLVELLVGAFLMMLVFAAMVSLLMPHLRSSSRMEVTLRLQDHWSRISHLIDGEVESASQLEVQPLGSSTLLRLTIPSRLSGQQARVVTYNLGQSANTAQMLLRSGPRILADGSLGETSQGDPSDTNQIVSTGVTSFVPILENGDRTLRLNISLKDTPSGISYQISSPFASRSRVHEASQ